ncbi:MAG TPA: phosphoglycolate phosphatase [Hyphomicrobiaceae bacterium]|nr:phosphoglycolate phosphatase [Hyphomicrobiaceae bacterium]
MHGYTLVFDLDGTLIDTAPDLGHAANHVLTGEGLPPVPIETMRTWIGHGARTMIKRGLRYHRVERSSAEVDALLVRFLDYYTANIAVESRPYPGLPEVLERARAGGAKLAVCTNKREQPSRLLLSALGLAGHFSAIAGADTFSVRKPDPGHLTGVIAQAGGDPKKSVFVGDSEIDVRTARSAGIPVIGIGFGYSDVPIREFRPDAVIDHYDEFDEALRHILNRS